MNLACKELELNTEINKNIELFYNNVNVGKYNADLVVEEKIVVYVLNNHKLQENEEQKAYWKFRKSKYEVSLILNFGINPEFKRKSR